MQLDNIIFNHAEYGYCKANLSIQNGIIDKITILDDSTQNLKNVEFYVTPGFVNSHLHPNQLFDRRLFDELSISELLHQMHNSIYKKTEEDRITQSLFVLMEAIKAGATTIYSVASHPDPVIQAYKQLGLKGAISCFFNDQWEGHGDAPPFSLYQAIEERFIAYHQEQNEKISIHIGSASIQSASNDLLILLDELAKRCKTKVNIHISEGIESVHSCLKSRQATPIRLLDKLGLLSKNWNLIHAVNIDEEEVKIIGKAGANVIHCPVSNAKTAVGVAPIAGLLKAGATIGLGTDACSNNNTNNILNEAYFATLIQSALHNDPRLLTTDIIMQFLTTNGYTILGRPQTGLIEIGQSADLLLWSLSESAFVPLSYANYNSTLIYNAPDIKPHTVMIDGKPVVENYQFLGSLQDEIRNAANACGTKFFNFETETR